MGRVINVRVRLSIREPVHAITFLIASGQFLTSIRDSGRYFLCLIYSLRDPEGTTCVLPEGKKGRGEAEGEGGKRK